VLLSKISYREKADEISTEIGDENVAAVYVLTADTKDSVDSTTKNGISLKGTITWIDHAGLNNELVSVSGSRSGSYSGDGKYIVTSGTHNVTNGSGSFSGTTFSNSAVGGEKGYSFTLTMHSYTASGDQTTLIVKTSAFD